MSNTRTRTAIGLAMCAGLLAGCGVVGATGQDYATWACDAYRDVERDQVTTTSEEATAVRDVARSDARAAAAFDPRWESLSSDIQTALELRELTPYWTQDQGDRFFEADRHVQDECADAGRHIGDLKP